MSKKAGIGRDFIQAKNSFNYPRDNYLIQGSGSYNQLSERQFIKARKQDDGAPTVIKDPNNDYQWAKWKPETTFDKMAKAHFKEMDRRKYEEERNKNMNLRAIQVQIPLAPPLPGLDNPLTQQLRNVKLKSNVFFDALENNTPIPDAPPQPQINPLGAQIRGQRRNLKQTELFNYFTPVENTNIIDYIDNVLDTNKSESQSISRRSSKGKAKLEGPPQYQAVLDPGNPTSPERRAILEAVQNQAGPSS